GSVPLKPPMAMTGLPVASWYAEAWFDPTVAATQVERFAEDCRAAVRAALGVLPFSSPPTPPRAPPRARPKPFWGRRAKPPGRAPVNPPGNPPANPPGTPAKRPPWPPAAPVKRPGPAPPAPA